MHRVFIYALYVMKKPIDPLRERLYGAHASQHAGCGDGEAAALIYHRDIPLAPLPTAGPVLDIGCGQGQLVKLMLADGYDAARIDVSPEQMALARPRPRAWTGSSKATTVTCLMREPGSSPQ